MNMLTRVLDRLAAGYMNRRFTAARIDRTTSDWVLSPIKTNDDIRSNLAMLVMRSRDLAKNDSDYRKWLSMRRKNVVGPAGMKMQSKVYNQPDQSGKLPRQDKIANAILEAEWGAWGAAGTPDRPSAVTLCGRHSWNSLLELVDRTWAIDGEAFVRVIRGADNPWAFTLQPIDSVLVDVNYNVARLENDKKIIMGVEVDKGNRALAYYVLTEGDYGSIARARIPAIEIVHLFRQEFVGQVRGFPQASAAILDMNMSAGYAEAELVAARVAACNMGIWERPTGAGGKLNLDNKGSADEKPTMDMEPGKFALGPKGWVFKELNPTHPGQQVAAFMKVVNRRKANGLDVAYNDFANDLEGVSFSSIRSGTLSERDGWKMDQGYLVDHYCQPVREVWLQQLLLTGRTPLPFSKFDKFNHASFIPRRWDWVDPLRDVKADAAAAEMLVLSPQEIIRDSGREPDEVLEEIATWQALVKAHGLTIGTSIVKGLKDDEEKE